MNIKMNTVNSFHSIAKFNWGLVASNTYHQHGKEYIYILIGERECTGQFEKKEFEVEYMNTILNEWFESFV